MFRDKSLITSIGAFGLLCATDGLAADGALTVNVLGGEPDRGQMMISIFGTEATYMKQPVAGAQQAVDSRGNARVVFKSIHFEAQPSSCSWTGGMAAIVC